MGWLWFGSSLPCSTMKHLPMALPTCNPSLASYVESQAVDLFGELAGISFTPEGDRLYVAVSGAWGGRVCSGGFEGVPTRVSSG